MKPQNSGPQIIPGWIGMTTKISFSRTVVSRKNNPLKIEKPGNPNSAVVEDLKILSICG